MSATPRGNLGNVDWGYCEHCGRDVELRPNGRLALHRTYQGRSERDGWMEKNCAGSLGHPAQPPEEKEGGEDGQAETNTVP